MKSLLGRLTNTPGGGAARCDGPATDSPSDEAADQLMICKQTFRQHAVQSATPFHGSPPTDYRKAGPHPPGCWRLPYQPLHPNKRLSDITASSANSAATSHASPGSSDPRATGGRASTDGGDETVRRMSLSSEAPTTPSVGFAEGEEACETHALQPEPTTARGAAEGAAGGAAAAGAPTPDPVAEPVGQEAHGEAHEAAHGTPVDEGAAVGAAAGAAPAAAPMPERVAEAVEEVVEEEVRPCRPPRPPHAQPCALPRPGPSEAQSRK